MGITVKKLFAPSCRTAAKWTRRRTRDCLIAMTTAMVLAVVPAAAQTVCIRATDGAFVVDVVLNGTVTVRGTLDTGASDLILLCDHARVCSTCSRGRSLSYKRLGADKSHTTPKSSPFVSVRSSSSMFLH
jgi:hypothetical protein